ncbi:MAG: hypothetical protein LC768_15350 [Acidobacteria bacterium]|nr:hypothetical protein [Acidobacteriota bacterium]MCA1639682.1 hypothetical protein [Acidobacteriota bacterium]
MKILASILVLLLNYNLVLACVCANTNEAEQIKTLKRNDAVFQGKVISITAAKEELFSGEPYLDVDIQVLKAWKGVDSSKIIVRAEPKISSCSLDYEIGQTVYIVADGEPLKTDMCNRGIVSHEKFSEIFGTPKIFEDQQLTPEQKPETNEKIESFWSSIWQKIVSLFL